MDNATTKKLIGALIAIIVCLALSVMEPFAGLERQGMIVFGIFIGVILLMLFHVVHEAAAFLLLPWLWILAAGIPTATAFGGFTGSFWWFLLGMFTLVAGCEHSGLLKRFAFWLLLKMPATYRGQLGAIYTSSLVIGIFQNLAPVTLMPPVVQRIQRQMGLQNFSKGGAGLHLSVVAGTIIAGILLPIHGANLAVFGALPEEIRMEIGVGMYALAFLPAVIFMAAAMYFLLRKFYDPGTVKVEKTDIEKEWNNMGPMSKQEKFAGIILVLTLVLLVVSTFTKWPVERIGLFGALALLVTGVLPVKTFQTAVQWPILILVGVIFGIPGVLAASGVQDWLGNLLTPLLVPLIGNMFLFAIGLFGVALLIRLISPSFSVPGVILVVALTSPLMEAGVSPFIIVLVYTLVMRHWLLPHTNPTHYMVVYGLTEGTSYTHAQGRVNGSLYLLLAFLALLISYPYWILIGLI